MSEIALAADRPKRVQHNPNWWQQMAEGRFHPYNKRVNDLLFGMSQMLQHINPGHLDVDLARLYALSMGDKETSLTEDAYFDTSKYQEILGNKYAEIEHWLYNAIATQVDCFRSMFDLEATYLLAEEDERWRSFRFSNDRYDWTDRRELEAPVELGFTMDFPETLKVYLFELVEKIENEKITLECPAQMQQLKYDLEQIKFTMRQAKNRETMNFMDEMTGAKFSEPRPRMPETFMVGDIAGPLISLVPQLSYVKHGKYKDTAEFREHMEKCYNTNNLKLYGLIFEVLSGLRNVTIEGTLKETVTPSFYSDDLNSRDLVEQRSRSEPHFKWISTLPSYRPEFVITLNDFSTFHYRYKRDAITKQDCCSLQYLVALEMFRY